MIRYNENIKKFHQLRARFLFFVSFRFVCSLACLFLFYKNPNSNEKILFNTTLHLYTTPFYRHLSFPPFFCMFSVHKARTLLGLCARASIRSLTRLKVEYKLFRCSLSFLEGKEQKKRVDPFLLKRLAWVAQ